MFLSLLKFMGTARSFLLLFIFAALLFGVPLVLIALSLIEMMSGGRYRVGRMSGKRHEFLEPGEDKSTNDTAPTGFIGPTSPTDRIISGADPSALREWTPSKHMR